MILAIQKETDINAVYKNKKVLSEEVLSNEYVDHVDLELLSMKALPIMLEQKIYEELKIVTIGGKDYEFRFAGGNDAEVSDSHCGRYFELVEKTEEQKQTQPVRGWLGMMYSSTHTGKSGSYRDDPRFIIEIDKNFANAHKFDDKIWYNDSWGWKCYDCKFDSCEGILQSIRDGFIMLGEKLDSNNPSATSALSAGVGKDM